MIETEKKKVKEDCILTITAVKLHYNEKLLKEGGALDKSCDKAEGARLLETMRKICNATGGEEVEYATLAYEEALQEMKIREDSMQTHT